MMENIGITKIKVFGIGGAGCNAINKMISNKNEEVEFFAVNTDKQALNRSLAKNKIEIGRLGAGGDPKVGKACAIENIEQIEKAIKDADMVYVVCGEGGGTGTGAAPVVAKLTKEKGILTVGVITKPFMFEGPKRNKNAKEGLEELRQYCDSIIIISNENLLKVFGNLPMLEAFNESDKILERGVKAVTDLITKPSLINLDFADVKYTMTNAGESFVGIGAGKGDRKVYDAAINALKSPLIEANVKSAKKAIINVIGDSSISLFEVNSAIEKIKEVTNSSMDIIFGVQTDIKLNDEAIVTVIVTGTDSTSQIKMFDTYNPSLLVSDKIIQNSNGVINKIERVNEILDIPRFDTSSIKTIFEEPEETEKEEKESWTLRNILATLFESE